MIWFGNPVHNTNDGLDRVVLFFNIKRYLFRQARQIEMYLQCWMIAPSLLSFSDCILLQTLSCNFFQICYHIHPINQFEILLISWICFAHRWIIRFFHLSQRKKYRIEWSKIQQCERKECVGKIVWNRENHWNSVYCLGTTKSRHSASQ